MNQRARGFEGSAAPRRRRSPWDFAFSASAAPGSLFAHARLLEGSAGAHPRLGCCATRALACDARQAANGERQAGARPRAPRLVRAGARAAGRPGVAVRRRVRALERWRWWGRGRAAAAAAPRGAAGGWPVRVLGTARHCAGPRGRGGWRRRRCATGTGRRCVRARASAQRRVGGEEGERSSGCELGRWRRCRQHAMQQRGARPLTTSRGRRSCSLPLDT